MKKLTLILLALFMLVGCGGNEQIEPKEEPIQEEVVEEPTTYIVELNEIQTQLLDKMEVNILADLRQDNGDGTSKYEIPLEDKDKVLEMLDICIDAELVDVYYDGKEILEDIYHSKDYQLYRIYFSNKSIDAQNLFSTLFAKTLFEYGLIYNKFNEKDGYIIIIYYDDSGSTELKTISSDMLDL